MLAGAAEEAAAGEEEEGQEEGVKVALPPRPLSLARTGPPSSWLVCLQEACQP